MQAEPFLVIKTGNDLKEDEVRLVDQLALVAHDSQQEFYYAVKKDFKMSDSEEASFELFDPFQVERNPNILYIGTQQKKPFLPAKINSFETITEIDSNTVASGDYNISFHYHLKEKKFRFIHNNLIIVKKTDQAEHWEYFNSIRATSGFYEDFIVYEQKIHLDNHSQYQFLLNGPMKDVYHISDFLLRPANSNLKIKQGNTTLYNNYPR